MESTNIPQVHKRNERWIRIQLFVLYILLLGILITGQYLLSQYNTLEARVLKEILYSLIPIISIAIIYEVGLRRSYLRLLSDWMKMVSDDNTKSMNRLSSVVERELKNTEALIINEARDLVKKHYKTYVNLKENGIVGIYKDLDDSKVWNKITNISDTTILIKSIWSPHLSLKSNVLSDAIRRGCTIKILLVHPKKQEAIQARAKSIPTESSEGITKKIEDCIKDCKSIYDRLETVNKGKFELRLHENFIASPIIAFDDEVYLAHYFPGFASFENPIIKCEGITKRFTKKLLQSFNYDWDNSGKVDFENDAELKSLFGHYKKYKVAKSTSLLKDTHS